jgi:transposase-like protein
VTDDNLSQDGAMSDGRVDRSYLAVRNKAMLEAYQRGASYNQLAEHYGISRASVKWLLWAERAESPSPTVAKQRYGCSQQTAAPQPHRHQQSAPR